MVLASVPRVPDAGFPGMPMTDGSFRKVRTKINNAPTTPGVFDLVFTAVNTHTYTATIYGIPVSYLSDSSATLAEIRDGILAAIAAVPALAAQVSAAASGNNVRITELAPETYGRAFSGTGGVDASTTLNVVTEHSQTQPMPAGIGVIQGTVAMGVQSCQLPNANTNDSVIGIVEHQHHPVNEQQFPSPSSILYPAGSEIPVGHSGEWLVRIEQDIAIGDPVYCRWQANGVGKTQLGAFRKDSDGGTALQLTQGAKWTGTGTAGGVAQLALALT